MAETGGGANVGGDVSAGGDFVGRDKFNVGDGATSAAIGSGNRVEINTGGRGERHSASDSDLIDSLQRAITDIKEMKIALLGSPWNPRAEPGLVWTVNKVLDEQQVARDDRQRLAREQVEIKKAQEKNYQKIKEEQEEKYQGMTSRISSAVTLTWVSLVVVGLIGLVLIYILVA